MAKKDFKKNTAELFFSDTEPEPAEPQTLSIPKGYQLVKEYKTERMQLLVRPATKAAIKKAASTQGMSMNDFITMVLEEYIERQE